MTILRQTVVDDMKGSLLKCQNIVIEKKEKL